MIKHNHPLFVKVKKVFNKKFGAEVNVWATTLGKSAPRIWRVSAVNKDKKISYQGAGWGIEAAVADLLFDKI